MQASNASFCASIDQTPLTVTPTAAADTQTKQRRPTRFPGTKGIGGSIELSSLIPAALTPIELEKVAKAKATLAYQRSMSTMFIFYVEKGQTSLPEAIANMVRLFT